MCISFSIFPIDQCNVFRPNRTSSLVRRGSSRSHPFLARQEIDRLTCRDARDTRTESQPCSPSDTARNHRSNSCVTYCLVAQLHSPAERDVAARNSSSSPARTTARAPQTETPARTKNCCCYSLLICPLNSELVRSILLHIAPIQHLCISFSNSHHH
jgi:hypothetical protein